MNITLFGSGYVGLVSAVCFAELGHHVLCIDVDEEKIARLQQGIVDIYEPFLPELLERHLNSGQLQFSTDVKRGTDFATLQFICVGTPSNPDGSADLNAVFNCVDAIVHHMDDFRIFIIKSTVPIGTSKHIAQRIAGILDKRRLMLSYALISNPEFLREGQAVHDFMHPDRVIIGTDSKVGAELVKTLYAPLCDTQHPCLLMDNNTAEFTKYAANAMLACRISFMNEMANLADHLEVDIKQVEKGLQLDPRIGAHFLSAGCGYGGSCFPKDVKALRHMAHELNYDAQILNAIDNTNEKQKAVLFEKIAAYFNKKLRGKVFALWGLSFKPQTNDMREASSQTIIKHLLAAGTKIQAYDPVAIPEAKKLYAHNEQITFCENALDCLIDADALIIVTEWPEFKAIDLITVKSILKHPLIFDGRNIFDLVQVSSHGLQYIGIGRRAHAPLLK